LLSKKLKYLTIVNVEFKGLLNVFGLVIFQYSKKYVIVYIFYKQILI
jgi:hypothetical protein